MTDPLGRVRDGRLFDGVTPEPRPVTVTLEAGVLVLAAAAGEPQRWPIAELKVVNPGGRDGPVQLERQGEAKREALIVDGGGFLAELRAANGGKKVPGLGADSAAVRFILAFGAFGLATIVALWLWGIPALAQMAADSVPPEWERKFGQMTVQRMVNDSQRVTDPRIVGPVESLFAQLVTARNSKRDSFVVIVARDKMVNAFAAPGGYVVVMTGLLGVMESPDELAAVMAHEITHATNRHSTRQMFKSLGVRALIGLVLGDQGFSGTLGNAAGTLGELSNSRSDEEEADEGAVTLLAKAGFDPRAHERALGRLHAASETGRRGPDVAFLSTHPSTPGRRARALELADAAKVEGTAELPDGEAWRALRAAAAGMAEPTKSSEP